MLQDLLDALSASILVVFLGYLAWMAFALVDSYRQPRGGWLGGDTLFGRMLASRHLMRRPTLLLVPAKGKTASKVGGVPKLPDDMKWPATRGGPRAFLAQIDLAAVRWAGGPEWLPKKGFLFAFYAADRQQGSNAVQILYSRKLGGLRQFPPNLAPHLRFAQRRAEFIRFESFPSGGWVDGSDWAKLTDDQVAQLERMSTDPFGDELQHRIGGYPNEVHGGCLRRECERLARRLPIDAELSKRVERLSWSWRLLFQFDSDEALGMDWGDEGRLYVFIREKDALAGDFSKTVTIHQRGRPRPPAAPAPERRLSSPAL